MKETMLRKNFEPLRDERYEFERGREAAQISLDLGMIAMNFARIDRVPRYADNERENDVEHSYMLGLVAPEIAVALELPLDIGLISQYATVHDLIETKTGDIATFLFTESQQLQKELNEQAALRELSRELPPHTAQLLVSYETQLDAESRFVRYVDKLLPIVVDIVGSGTKVMEEDYGISTLEQLQACHLTLQKRLHERFGDEFPEITLAHQMLCELFENKFAINL